MTNKEFCSSCRGACCKSSPGATLPEDWGAPDADLMKDRLETALSSGRWCVALAMGTLPLPYVMPTPDANGWCSFLTKDGCAFPTEAERPAACRDFTPAANFPHGCYYPVHVTLGFRRASNLYYASKWTPYRKLLEYLVDKYQHI